MNTKEVKTPTAKYGEAFDTAVDKHHLIETIKDIHNDLSKSLLIQLKDMEHAFKEAGKGKELKALINALQKGEKIQPLASLQYELITELNQLFGKGT